MPLVRAASSLFLAEAACNQKPQLSSTHAFDLLAFIALGFFGDELFILEVVNTHSVTYLSNRLLSYLASSSRTRSQNIIYALNILLIFSTSLAHRFEAIVEHIKQEFLAALGQVILSTEAFSTIRNIISGARWRIMIRP